MIWLIADDEPDILDILTDIVTRWGYEPLTLASGDAASLWLENVISGAYTGPLPGLALLDIRMPGLTGDQLAERIRQVDALRDMAIVMMTAFSLTDAERQQLLARTGADDLIWKPLPDMNELRAALHTAMEHRASQRETAWKVGCD